MEIKDRFGKWSVLFRVPKDPEGEYFLYLCDKFINKKSYGLWKRGRGKDRKERGGNGQGISLEIADWYGVYLLAKMDNGEVHVIGNRTQADLSEMRNKYSEQWQSLTSKKNLLQRIASMIQAEINEEKLKAEMVKIKHDLFEQEMIATKEIGNNL